MLRFALAALASASNANPRSMADRSAHESVWWIAQIKIASEA